MDEKREWPEVGDYVAIEVDGDLHAHGWVININQGLVGIESPSKTYRVKPEYVVPRKSLKMGNDTVDEMVAFIVGKLRQVQKGLYFGNVLVDLKSELSEFNAKERRWKS